MPAAQIPRFSYPRLAAVSAAFSVTKRALKKMGRPTPMGKRSRQEDYGTFNKKARAVVKSLPKNRIGANQGLIKSNQKVSHPKKGSIVYRRSCYGRKESPGKASWIGGSSLGTPTQHYRAIAHAILARYMLKMGDFRATNTEVGTTANPVFSKYQVRYAKDAPAGGSLIVDPTELNGAQLSNKSYEDMAIDFGAEIASMAQTGYFPVLIAFYDPDQVLASGETVPGITILRDTQLGRHKITVSIKGRFRFQNVTLASGSSVAANSNINAVDANPLSGKIYTFRNQAPLFSDSYLTTFDDIADIPFREGVLELQTVKDDFEMYGSVVGTGGKGGLAFNLEAPPLNPSSIWRNCSKTGQVVFPPGGFKTFNTSYLRSDSIRKYLKDITQSNYVNAGWGPGQVGTTASYPPAGDSFMMCLRPTLKTTSEMMEIVYDTEHVITASIQTRKPSPLQVVNTIE